MNKYFLLLSFIPSFVFGGTFLNTETFNAIPSNYGGLQYFGGLPTATGETGTVRQGCSVGSSSVCNSSHDVWGAGFFSPGGLIDVTLKNVYDLPDGDTAFCYIRAVWGLTSYEGQANTSNSSVLASMSQTYSNYATNQKNSVLVSDPVNIPFKCKDIPFLNNEQNKISVPLSSDSVYVNLTTYNGNQGLFVPPNNTSLLISYISVKKPVYFEYSALVCSTLSISSSTCARITSLPHIDLGNPETIIPVPPTDCNVEGDFIFDLGAVSKSNYNGTYKENILQAVCSRDTTLTLTLINETITSGDGDISVKMSVNNSGATSQVPLISQTPTSFIIKAEVSNINQSAEPGDYELSNILLISYN